MALTYEELAANISAAKDMKFAPLKTKNKECGVFGRTLRTLLYFFSIRWYTSSASFPSSAWVLH